MEHIKIEVQKIFKNGHIENELVIFKKTETKKINEYLENIKQKQIEGVFSKPYKWYMFYKNKTEKVRENRKRQDLYKKELSKIQYGLKVNIKHIVDNLQ